MTLWTVLEIPLGFALLFFGGNWLVDGSVGVARRLGVSPLMIGLTLVGFGTSTPELVTCLSAALNGSPGVAIGNVIGSNIANSLLILGVAAVLAPVACDPKAFRRDGPVLGAVTVLAVVFVVGGEIGRIAGGAFLLILLAYTVYTYFTERGQEIPAAQTRKKEGELVVERERSLGLSLGIALLGGVAILLGADWLVHGSVSVARVVGIPETVIGLTMVALGTSLPELATAIAGSRKGEGDVVLGNVLGSNVFNLLGILGTTALVMPLPMPVEIVGFDVWIMLAATVLLILFAVSGWQVTRREAILLLVGYAAYVAALAGPVVLGLPALQFF